jgi:predicted nucleic acid-binding protein
LILYLDTSALVKLYAEEPGREEVENAVREARVVAVSEIGYVEARSALARKEREGSFSTDEHDEAVAQLQQDYREVYLSRPITGDLIARAGGLARKHALRAYDAVHLATALVLREENLELAERVQESAEAAPREGAELQVALMTFDRSLTKGASNEGLAYSRQIPREEK